MKEQLDQIFAAIISLPRWKIFSQKELEVNDAPRTPIRAYIDGNTWDIKCEVDRNIISICYSTVQKFCLDSVYAAARPFETLLFAMILHEEGHWQICPFDRQYFEDILSGCYDGLRNSGRISRQSDHSNHNQFEITIWRECANCFEDLIVDSVISCEDRERESFTKGNVLFDLIYARLQIGPVSELFAIMSEVRVCLCDYSRALTKSLRSTYCADRFKVVTRQIVQILVSDKRLADKALARKLSDGDRKRIATILANPRGRCWYSKAKRFAMLVAPYIHKKDDCRQLPGSMFIRQLFPNRGDDSKNTQPQYDIDQFFLEQLATIALEKGSSVDYVGSFNLLNALYQERAREIMINYPIGSGNTLTTVTAIPLTTKKIDPDALNIKKAIWSKTRIHASDEIELYQSDLTVDIDEGPIVQRQTILDLALLVDSSGSMEADLVAGNEGPYDLLLRAQFSLLNWLEKNGKVNYMNFAVINFSSQTHFSGWHPYSEIRAIKEALFQFQGGGTTLNPQVIKSLYSKNKKSFLAILTTDGAISNLSDVFHELRALVRCGNQLVIIYIQNPLMDDPSAYAEMSNYAEIHNINNAHDLIGIKIDLAKKHWSR